MSHDLKSASKYINSVLASRGLLHGDDISFHKPGRDEETPVRIINLINELLKRREKDTEQKEALASTIRTLRTNETSFGAANDKLKVNFEELERKYRLLQGQERVLNSSARSAEATAKSLRDEVTRAKSTLQQVRTQCANDIRKRDHQIAKLKEKLLDTTRGGRGNKQTLIFPGVTMTAAASNSFSSSKMTSTSLTPDGMLQRELELAQENIKFLTELSQTLSDENETLTSMIRNTIANIRAASGWDDSKDEEDMEDELVTSTETSHGTLNGKLEAVLDNLRELLNQPNYVPLEDLEAKENEVDRLKVQLKNMLAEWRKAIELVDLVNNNRQTIPQEKQIKSLERNFRTYGDAVLKELSQNALNSPKICSSKAIPDVDAIRAEVADHLANLSKIEEESGLEGLSVAMEHNIIAQHEATVYEHETMIIERTLNETRDCIDAESSSYDDETIHQDQTMSLSDPSRIKGTTLRESSEQESFYARHNLSRKQLEYDDDVTVQSENTTIISIDTSQVSTTDESLDDVDLVQSAGHDYMQAFSPPKTTPEQRQKVKRKPKVLRATPANVKKRKSYDLRRKVLQL